MELRGHGARKWSSDAFKNRISTRIVMDVYGESILFFKSQKQLVAAIRDAIAAHRTLVNERDVLHRDISQNNILLGNEGARPGERGVLIDFDMALRGRRPLVHASGENTVGTRLFMSVAVLTTSTRLFTTSPHHDQLDDLESFYYVFYDLVNTWEGVGKQVADRPEEVKLWDVNPNPFTCAAHKQAHFFLPETPAMRFIPPYWLPATRELVIGMYQVIRKLILLKVPCRELKIETRKTALRELLASADQYYDEVLALFDKALDDLDTQESSDNPSAAVDSSIVDSSPSLPMVGDRLSSRASVNSLKRALPCDDEKPTILTKRARIASGPPPFSPHRTRAYVKAEATRAASNAGPIALSNVQLRSRAPLPKKSAAVTTFPPPRTRAAVKAALQHGNNRSNVPPKVSQPTRQHAVNTKASIKAFSTAKANSSTLPSVQHDPRRRTRSSTRAARTASSLPCRSRQK